MKLLIRIRIPNSNFSWKDQVQFSWRWAIQNSGTYDRAGTGTPAQTRQTLLRGGGRRRQTSYSTLSIHLTKLTPCLPWIPSPWSWSWRGHSASRLQTQTESLKSWRRTPWKLCSHCGPFHQHKMGRKKSRWEPRCLEISLVWLGGFQRAAAVYRVVCEHEEVNGGINVDNRVNPPWNITGMPIALCAIRGSTCHWKTHKGTQRTNEVQWSQVQRRVRCRVHSSQKWPSFTKKKSAEEVHKKKGKKFTKHWDSQAKESHGLDNGKHKEHLWRTMKLKERRNEIRNEMKRGNEEKWRKQQKKEQERTRKNKNEEWMRRERRVKKVRSNLWKIHRLLVK